MRRFYLAFALLAGCAGDPTYGDVLEDGQLPPRGHADLFTWLEAGHYQDWTCADTPYPPTRSTGHGRNRICSNDALASAVDGETYPVGAAAVKEIFGSDGEVELYAVARKMTAGEGGDSWYWYEGFGDRVIANDEGDSTCTGCHGGAPKDFVFIVAR